MPDITIPGNGGTGTGGFELGGDTVFVFIYKPTGIYKLVADQGQDVLYERTSATSLIVKIPDPYIRTAFLG